MKRFGTTLAVGVVLRVGTTAFAAEPSFRGLGYLFGGDTRAYAVSADGSVVVGWGGTSNVTEAFRWTLSGGMQPLGDAPGGFHHSDAIAISGNGSVVAGHAYPSQSPMAAIWDQTGLQLLPDPRPGHQTLVYGISEDGRYVVGQGSIDTQSGNTYPLRWAVGGDVESLGLLPGGTWGEAHAASAHGSIVVGVSEMLGLDVQPFRWAAAEGMTRLLHDDTLSGNATSISPDGSFIVGAAGKGDGHQQAYLIHGQSILWLGYLDDTLRNSIAYGVSDDGGIVVGQSQVPGSGFVSDPFIWDEVHGIRDLNQALPAEFGVDITGWHVEQVQAISGDGSTLVGWGIDPLGFEQAWIATIPLPEPTCCLSGISAALLLTRRRHIRQPQTHSHHSSSPNARPSAMA